jgi:hypothetical protein
MGIIYRLPKFVVTSTELWGIYGGMNLKEMFKEIRTEAPRDRIKVSLYISESIFTEFREACDDLAPSKVVERFMLRSVQENGEAHENIQ